MKAAYRSDNVTAAAAVLAGDQTGDVATKTVASLTLEEIDEAARKLLEFRAPGMEGSN